jgi:hypothetical protein
MMMPRDGDEEGDMISITGVVDEVAANRSAVVDDVGDEATDVAADGDAAAVGPKRIGSG